MALVPADWSATIRPAGDGVDFRYIGDTHTGASPSYATVIDFHRWAQDLLDDAVWSGDDQLDITVKDVSSRSTDQIIALLGTSNIDDASSEYLYGGTIIQANGDTIYDGIVNFGNQGIPIQILQNGLVIVNDFWNENGGLNADAAAGVSHQFMLKVRDGGVDIDGRRLLGTSREPNKTFSEFPINGTSRGINVLALSNGDDLNNSTPAATVATWNDIVNLNEGYISIDVNDDGTPENYYSNWDRGTRSINDLYERAKWLTAEGSAQTVYGLPGPLFRGITHEIDIDTNVGTFTGPEPVSWAGGTGQLLAIDDPSAGTKMYIQLLTGNAPADNDVITGGASAATAAVNVNVITHEVPDVFIGVSTGSSIIGALGVGIEATDLTDADQVFDLTGTQISPPNFAQFDVTGLVPGEDRVLVYPRDGVDSEGNPAIDYDQMALAAPLSSAAATEVVVATAIPADTPASGDIRVQADDGRYLQVPYSSWTGSTFTVPSFDFSGANVAAAANNVWIAYIDVLAGSAIESFVGVFSGSRDLGVRVRDGGGTPIKEFITPATFGASGGAVGTIRTSDL